MKPQEFFLALVPVLPFGKIYSLVSVKHIKKNPDFLIGTIKESVKERKNIIIQTPENMIFILESF